MCKLKKVFLASPSDLGDLRKKVAEVVNDFHTMDNMGSFQIESSDTTPGAVGIPQLNIDQTVRNCDYVIVLFKNKWGSSPGRTVWGFTSGTEEELFIGLKGIIDDSSTVSDILVVFIEGEDSKPDSEITKLKKQIEDKHVLQYKVANKDEDVLTIVQQNLTRWVKGNVQLNSSFDLVPSSGKPILQVCERLKTGLQRVKMGEIEKAEKDLLYAATNGGPEEKLEYARFLFSQGQYKKAKKCYESVIAQTDQYPESADFLTKAVAYSNIGNIYRKNNEISSAIYQHKQALRMFPKQLNTRGKEQKAEVYDGLGLSYHAQHDDQGENHSLENFKKALSLRKALNCNKLLFKSYVNLSREYRNIAIINGIGKNPKATQYLQLAEQYLDSADKIADDVTCDPRDSANYYLLKAQFENSKPEGENSDIIQHYACMSLDINRKINNIDGQAIAHNMLAQAYMRKHDYKQALEEAHNCLKINEQTKNRQGVIMSYRLLGNLYMADRKWNLAINSYREEVKMHEKNGNVQNFLFYGWALAKLAEAYKFSGDYESCEEYLQKAQVANQREKDQKLEDYLNSLK